MLVQSQRACRYCQGMPADVWKLQVLDGAMACPPEDSNGLEGMGNHFYQEFLDLVLAAKNSASFECKRKYMKLCAEVSTALNYKERSVG